MVSHISLFPHNLGANQAYMQLIDDYVDVNRTGYDLLALFNQFGTEPVNEIIDLGFLKQSRTFGRYSDWYELAFVKKHTIPHYILEAVTEEPKSFAELLLGLPVEQRISSHQLKNILAFLMNFQLIQEFVMPGSAITFIAADNEAMDESLDKVYKFSDRLESKFIYQMNVDENVEEFLELKGL